MNAQSSRLFRTAGLYRLHSSSEPTGVKSSNLPLGLTRKQALCLLKPLGVINDSPSRGGACSRAIDLTIGVAAFARRAAKAR